MTQLALDYIVRILILAVVATVIILTIINFSDEIKTAINKWLFKEEKKIDFPKTEEKEAFSSGEIAKYIQSCYSAMESLPEIDQKDTICYILLAKRGFSANSREILNLLSEELRNRTEIIANFSKSYVKIEFKDIGDKILVTD